MKYSITIAAVILFLAPQAGIAWQKQQNNPKQPNQQETTEIPGFIHSAPCKMLAPGVYDCGNHKNQLRSQNQKSQQWKVEVKPTKDVTVTVKNKVDREAAENNLQ